MAERLCARHCPKEKLPLPSWEGLMRFTRLSSESLERYLGGKEGVEQFFANWGKGNECVPDGDTKGY